MRGFRPLIAIVIAVSWLAAVIAAPAEGPSMPQGWRFSMPVGDAAAGEKAYEKMKCYTCHKIPGRVFGNPADSPGGVGPTLTRAHARLTREYLAESILNTDKFLAHGNYQMSYRAEDGTSKMGRYHEVMTLGELVNIVEFVRTIR